MYLDLFNKITNKCYIVGMFATLCIQKGFNNVHDQNCAENFKSIKKMDASANLQQSLLKEPVLQVWILNFLQN